MAALNDPNFDFWFFFRLLGLTIYETKDIYGYRIISQTDQNTKK